ncbi:MAG: DUF5662 family protein [Roseiflexaceae bacterium]
MLPHLRYLAYVLRHKWHVFVACRGLHVPLWQAIIHDWTKFLPCEWFPYVQRFYGAATLQRDHKSDAFDRAWNHHQKSNRHHWQYWALVTERDAARVRALAIPPRYAREMVADWIGAGRAQGKPDVAAWYAANAAKMVLHEHTRTLVEQLIGEAQRRGLVP